MQEHSTVVTRKGQITIPAAVRKALGLKRGDRVALVLDNGYARLGKGASVVERTAGVVRSTQPPLSARELRGAAEEAWAAEAVERGG